MSMGRKSAKRFGKKLEDKYIKRRASRSAKYSWYYPIRSVQDEVENESVQSVHFETVGKRLYFNRNKKQQTSEEKVRKTLLEMNNRDSIHSFLKRCVRVKTRRYGKSGIKILENEFDSDKGNNLVLWKYGSLGWDIF